MKGLLLISAILINLGWSYAYPGGPQGVGAFAYQDSTGNSGPVATRMFSARPSQSLSTLLPPMRSPRSKPFRSFKPFFRRRFAPFNGFPNFFDFGGATSFGMPNFGGPNTNSAFASGYAGPGFTHQVAAINPPNPQMGNVNVMSRSNDDGSAGGNKPRYQSVSSSSYATSSNINGKTTSQRRAETVVNNDGKITRYEVHN